VQHQPAQTDLMMVIGINIDTSFAGQQDQKDIQKLWEHWFSAQVSQQIPHKIDDKIYNIYHNYQERDQGSYSVLLGHVVSSLDQIPEGLSGLSFQPGRQVHYQVEGALPDAVISTWQNIRQSQDYRRAYIADYDVYQFASDPQQPPVVNTYVSVLGEQNGHRAVV